MLVGGRWAADVMLTPFCGRKQKALSRCHSNSCFSVQPGEIMLPRDVLFWAGPCACPPLPLHALLRLPQVTEWAEWAMACYFRAFQAILGSGCETLWAGRKGQAFVSALRATLGLGMFRAGWRKALGCPQKAAKGQPGSCRGQGGWEDTRGCAAWQGAGGDSAGEAPRSPGNIAPEARAVGSAAADQQRGLLPGWIQQPSCQQGTVGLWRKSLQGSPGFWGRFTDPSPPAA